MPPEAHQQFLDRALPILKEDPRLAGVAVGGSWLRGMDQFSDLDLLLVSSDEDHAGLMQDRMALAAKLGTLLSAFTGEHVNEPRLIICLYDKPLLHVDLKFIALSSMLERIENSELLWERNGALSGMLSIPKAPAPKPDLQWIEDRFWVWMHYCSTKLGRGEYFEILDALAFLRARVLAPLAYEMRGLHPRGLRRLETLIPGDLMAFRATLATDDKASCSKAIFATAAFYRRLRDSLAGPSFKPRAEAEVAAMKYLAEISG